MERNTPEKKFSTGAISATVWQNHGKKPNGEPTIYRTITIDRRYKDKDGSWKSTNNIRVNDLPKLVLVANKAYEYLALRSDNTISDGDEDE